MTPSCFRDSDLCHYLWRVTDQKWLAESSYWIVVKPLRILLIIAAAFVVRFLVHRAITRVIRRGEAGDGEGGRAFVLLRRRMPDALRGASFLPDVVVPSERRRQRALALGSVLRNIASTVVFAITAMLVLDELSVNLAPILASAGIVGLAVGFGAQNLVKDFLAGMFILMEDQFGVGDTVELGQLAGILNGTVESVSLRITTLRDDQGALWYIRNGEIIRVGNKSQGSALASVDIPVKTVVTAEASDVLTSAADRFSRDDEWSELITAPAEVLGIEEVTEETTVLRTVAKTSIEAQARVERELRRRLTVALHEAGLIAQGGDGQGD